MDLGESIAYQARHQPNHVALICEEQELSWLEFYDAVNRFANAIRDIGAAHGDRVLLLLDNSIEFVVCTYALGRIGCISAPVKPGSVSRETNSIAESVNPAFVVADADSIETVDDLQSGSSLTSIGVGDNHGMDHDFQSLITSGSPRDPPSTVSMADPFMIMFTGGTMGTPKGCVRTHLNYFMAALIRLVEVPFTDDDLSLIATPLATGFSFGILMKAVFGGVPSILLREFDPDAYFDAIEQQDVTLAYAVMERMGQRLTSHDRFESVDFSSLRLYRALIPREQLERFYEQETFHAGFTTIYGSSETGVVVIKKPEKFEEELASSDPENALGSVGREALLTEVVCLDDDHNPVAAGDIGRLAVRGPTVFRGYWDQPDLNEEIFHEGWLLTDDLALKDEEGYVYLRGRRDDMIQSGGLNVYPFEVKSVLQSHEKVLEAVDIGIPDPEWGEKVVACVVTSETIEEDALLDHCRRNLAPYKVPKTVIFREKLPRNESGKVLKHRIQTMVEEAASADETD